MVYLLCKVFPNHKNALMHIVSVLLTFETCHYTSVCVFKIYNSKFAMSEFFFSLNPRKDYFEAYFDRGPPKISTAFRTQTQQDAENTYISNISNKMQEPTDINVLQFRIFNQYS